MYAYHCQVCQPNPHNNEWQREKVHSLVSLMGNPEDFICQECKAALIKAWAVEIQSQHLKEQA